MCAYLERPRVKCSVGWVCTRRFEFYISKPSFSYASARPAKTRVTRTNNRARLNHGDTCTRIECKCEKFREIVVASTTIDQGIKRPRSIDIHDATPGARAHNRQLCIGDTRQLNTPAKFRDTRHSMARCSHADFSIQIHRVNLKIKQTCLVSLKRNSAFNAEDPRKGRRRARRM